jgi:hypothetical protein
MSDGIRILCREHSGISPEQVRDARARAWAFVFQCYQGSQKGAESVSEHDGYDAAAIVTSKKGGTV